MSEVNFRRWLRRHWAANARKRARSEMRYERKYKDLRFAYRVVCTLWALTAFILGVVLFK
jgi:hypothetical protein